MIFTVTLLAPPAPAPTYCWSMVFSQNWFAPRSRSGAGYWDHA
jgi:hypothetical protein